MSNRRQKGRNTGASKKAFQVKAVRATDVAAIILEELSHQYHEVCNFLEAADLVRSGNTYLAYLSVLSQRKPFAVSSPVTHWVYAQAAAAVKKLVDPAWDRMPATYSTWWSNEARCRKLNRKFDLLEKAYALGNKTRSPYHREMARARTAIQFVLGLEPPIDEITESSYYGPGSSTDVKGSEVHYVRKLSAEECTPLCVDLASQSFVHDKALWAHIGMDPAYTHIPSAREGFIRVMREKLAQKVNDTDDLMFVHKNIAVQRSICAQPTASGSVQLGVHVVIARRLLSVGIDLGDQGWNQKLARRGSLNWEDADPFCTLDKKDASALLCASLPRVLFPAPWYKLLNRTRTPRYRTPMGMGGDVHSYEMYGGMGNGTTFCVQTLVFWACAYATSSCSTVEEFVAEREYAVYGDDVILRRSHAAGYMNFMEYLGFRFNKQKTFLDGPFRESCGADFYAGQPVRPATLDSENGILRDLDLIGIHNTLADNAFPLEGACARIRSLWERSVFPQMPTDPAGNLGFRPLGGKAYYSIVRDGSGKPLLSAPWQRPRTYVMEVRAKHANLGTLDPYTQIAVSLLRARQGGGEDSQWSLPFRGLVNTRVVAEVDLVRKDQIQMVANQLARLVERKKAPWWNDHRGTVQR